MKQVVIKKGQPLVVEVSEPNAMAGFLLVDVRASCVSPGTEMAGIASSGKSLLQRAIEQPDKAKTAIRQMRAQGFREVWQKAKNKFDKEGLCGYSAAGVVLDVGEGVEGFHRGMRVAVAGGGLANHADLVAVPVNLCVPIPAGVSFEEASSVALGGIAMQAMRRAEVSLGERVGVIGCGPLGLLAVQMLSAAGCRVFAADLDRRRLEMARNFGAECVGHPAEEDVVTLTKHWSGGIGLDAVIVFTATQSGEPVSQAFRMCRRKGRVVLAGVAGGEYKRDDMYQKELDFVVSTSYGPGRYDDDYELRGHDYPIGYVRWTEKRNMQAYLDLLELKRVDVASLIEVTCPLERAAEAYEKLKAPEKPLLAVLLSPEHERDIRSGNELTGASSEWCKPAAGGPVGLALVGAGAFVQAKHVPAIQAMGDKIKVLHSIAKTGTGARNSAALFDHCQAGTNLSQALADPAVHAVLIGTRHNSHAELSIAALRAGKAVFVEKPMCLSPNEMIEVQRAVMESGAPYMVGYNRRFSPFAQKIRELVAGRNQPLMIQYTMNAGFLPAEHWTQGPEGGGRLQGEGCHLVDLFRSIIAHPVREISCSPLRSSRGGANTTDNFSLTLSYEDGSVATLIYTALGNKAVPKEQMQIHFDEKSIVLDDYRAMRCSGIAGADMELKAQDKGHARELNVFRDAVASGERFPIPWDELCETWQVCWQADQICRTGEARASEG